MSIGNCPLSNQLIPLPLNDDKAMSGKNGVSVSESEVSALLGVVFKERMVWLQMCCKKRHKSPFLVPKQIGKNPTAGFSISMCSTPNNNHLTPLRTDTFQVMGNMHVTALI